MSAAGPVRNVTAGRDIGRSRPRGYAPWHPQPKTLELLDDVFGVIAEYEDHLPLSVRQIYYRLVATTGYPKTENAYANLAEHLNRARRARLIAFDHIRDDGVTSQASMSYGSPEDFWDMTARRIRAYTRDRQAGQPCYIELWCEAAGMLPQLAGVAAHYSVPVYSAGGYNSVTANHSVAVRALRRNGLTVLLHVGDLDPSGESIFRSMADDVAAFVKVDRTLHTQAVEADRVALTRDQVDEHDLPTSSAKASDGRSRSWTGGTCQLEALPPDVLAKIVKTAIEDRRDLDRLQDVLDEEDDDRADLFGALPAGPT